jgi:hypothetical protein
MGILRRTSQLASGLSAGLLLLAVVLPSHSGAQSAKAQDLGNRLVLVVSSRSATRKLRAHTVRAIFLGKPTSSPSGGAYIPLNHPPRSTLRVAFDRQFLGMNPAKVGRYWVDQRIRGRVRPPRTVASLRTLRLVVARLELAISYIRADDLMPGLRPVEIDGLDFRDPAYPWTAVH